MSVPRPGRVRPGRRGLRGGKSARTCVVLVWRPHAHLAQVGLSLQAAGLSPSAPGRSGVGIPGHGAGCTPSQTQNLSASPPLQRPRPTGDDAFQ